MSAAQSAAVAAVTASTQSAALYGDSAALANKEPTDNSVAIRFDTALHQSTALSGGPWIAVTIEALDEDASLSDPAGQAVIRGSYIGTPVWALEDDATGKYAISSSTGAITVDDTLTEGTDAIEIAVTGVTPAVPNQAASIVVDAGAGV